MRQLIAILLCASLAPMAHGAAPAEAVRFCDLEIDAKSVVFVCDGSRSTKNKIDDLADELARAIEPMTPDQQFAVVFFADDRTSGPADGKLVPATDENKRLARNWLDDVKAGDKSTPHVGLTRAFEAKPQAVVFVSDGRFDDFDAVEKQVETLNAGRAVQVHTVGFFRNEKEDDSRRFAKLMQDVAERNAGKFKAAYADKLKRGAK